jgi:hypothetical protein
VRLFKTAVFGCSRSGSARTRFGDRLFFLDFGMGGGLLDRHGFRRSKPSYTVLVHNGVMKVAEKAVRQSVSLPPRVAKQVGSMAKSRKLSKNRMLLELIENGIDADKRKQQQFFALAERFRNEQDPEAANRLGDELGRMVFGG